MDGNGCFDFNGQFRVVKQCCDCQADSFKQKLVVLEADAREAVEYPTSSSAHVPERALELWEYVLAKERVNLFFVEFLLDEDIVESADHVQGSVALSRAVLAVLAREDLHAQVHGAP